MATYTLTEDAFVRAMGAAMRTRLFMMGAILSALGLLVALDAFHRGGGHRWAFVAAIPFLLGAIPLVRRSKWRRLYRQTPLWNEPVTFLPSEDGYTIQTPSGRSQQAWKDAWRVDIKAGFLLIWVNSSMFRLIPLNVLSPEELGLVRASRAKTRKAFRGNQRS